MGFTWELQATYDDDEPCITGCGVAIGVGTGFAMISFAWCYRSCILLSSMVRQSASETELQTSLKKHGFTCRAGIQLSISLACRLHLSAA